MRRYPIQTAISTAALCAFLVAGPAFATGGPASPGIDAMAGIQQAINARLTAGMQVVDRDPDFAGKGENTEALIGDGKHGIFSMDDISRTYGGIATPEATPAGLTELASFGVTDTQQPQSVNYIQIGDYILTLTGNYRFLGNAMCSKPEAGKLYILAGHEDVTGTDASMMAHIFFTAIRDVMIDKEMCSLYVTDPVLVYDEKTYYPDGGIPAISRESDNDPNYLVDAIPLSAFPTYELKK